MKTEQSQQYDMLNIHIILYIFTLVSGCRFDVTCLCEILLSPIPPNTSPYDKRKILVKI